MIVDKTRHPTENLRTAEHLLLVLLMATEEDEPELFAINTVVGQALMLVRDAAERLDAEMPKPDPIDFSAPIERMVPRDAA